MGLDQVTPIKTESALDTTSISTNTDTNGNDIDLTGDAHGLTIIVQSGSITDGDYSFTVQESTDGGSSWSDVSSDQIVGSIPDLDSTNANEVNEVGYIGSADDVRLQVTSTNVSTGGDFTATAVKRPVRKST